MEGAKRPALTVAAGVVQKGNAIMLCRRRAEVHNGRKWEFPGGKLEPGESPEAALARELREELAIGVSVGRVLDAVYYRYTDRDVLVLFYPCVITDGEPRPLDCDAVAWVRPSELSRYDLAGADAAFVRRNLERIP